MGTPEMQQGIIDCFIRLSGVLLSLTAIAKLISISGHAKILKSMDPVFLISFRHLFLLTAIAELTVAGVCFAKANRTFKISLIALLASYFFLYRIGFYWEGWSNICPCLGTLTDALHISPATADMAMKLVLIYLLVGSYLILFLLLSAQTYLGVLNISHSD